MKFSEVRRHFDYDLSYKVALWFTNNTGTEGHVDFLTLSRRHFVSRRGVVGSLCPTTPGGRTPLPLCSGTKDQ